MILFYFSSKNGQQEASQQANKREKINISTFDNFESEPWEYNEGDKEGLYEQLLISISLTVDEKIVKEIFELEINIHDQLFQKINSGENNSIVHLKQQGKIVHEFYDLVAI